MPECCTPYASFVPVSILQFYYNETTGMAKWLARLSAVWTRAAHECRFSVQCKVIALPAFYDAITGPTQFIISLVNSVKMVNMP